MKTFSNIFTSLLVALIVTTLISACSSAADMPEPSLPDGPMVTLDLNVDLLIDRGELPAVASRAYPITDDNTFEGPATAYENLATLRVIIVRQNGVVEYNRLIRFDNPMISVPLSEDLKFRVLAGELKTIYLIGNEDFVESSTDFDFSSVVEGEIYPAVEIANLTFSATNSQPVINNQTSTGYIYLPMSEFFEIDVPMPHETGDLVQAENLFVTRSLTKFSFSLNTSVALPDNFKISGIRIDGLSDCSYFIPRETVYDPQKNLPTTDGGRYITSFALPPQAGNNLNFTFPVMPSAMPSPGHCVDIDSYFYLPESKTSDSFTVNLVFDGDTDGRLSQLYSGAPLDIKDIPRNTHVKINIYIEGHSVRAQVDLVPYTGVYLDPVFGM